MFSWIKSRFQSARALWQLIDEAQAIIDAIEKKDYDRAVKHASKIIALTVSDQYEAVLLKGIDGLYNLVTSVVTLYQMLSGNTPKLLVSSVDDDIASIPGDLRNIISIIGKPPLKAMCTAEDDEEPTVEIDPFIAVAILSLIVNSVRLIIDLRRRRKADDDHNP